MATLVWDRIGERIYQGGVDRGVLYLQDGRVAVWNGLVDIEESTTAELKTAYLDGVKYLEMLVPGDFAGKLKALTYPDEFDSVNGIVEFVPGFDIYEQPSKSFNLSYRTKIGNDIDGLDHGYKIHILYNVVAKPEASSFGTLNDSSVAPVEFSWSLTGTPPKMGIVRPAVHISINSLTTPPDILEMLENKLYGTATSEASFPSIQEVAEYFGYLGALVIIDHGDGTWSAIDQSDGYITMVDSTTFRIDNVDAVYSGSVTYQVSSTNVGNSL